MRLLAILLAFSLPFASAWFNTAWFTSATKQLQKRADPPYYVFFTNCWGNPGARSEIDFFQTYPTTFGNATPPYAYVVDDNENYVWANGGSAIDPNGNNFTWTINQNATPQDTAVGTASDGNGHYTLVRIWNETLYSPHENGIDYGCVIVYFGQLDGQLNSLPTPISSTSSTSSATSSSTSSTSSGAAAAAATATATSAPGATATSVPQDTGLSTGAKAGIAVGIVVGASATLGMLGFLLWRRRQSSHKLGVDSNGKKILPYPDGVGAIPMGQYAPQEMHHWAVPSQLAGNAVSEVGGKAVSEMPAIDRGGHGYHGPTSNHPFEMDGGMYPSPR